jgi:amino acid transporter
MPRALLSCMSILIITAFLVLFTSCASAPGVNELSTADFPFKYAFSQVFSIPERVTLVLNVPAIFATAFGFIFAAGKQMSAMAKSGLFPAILGRATMTTRTPYASILFVSFCAFIVALIVYFIDHTLVDELFHICALGSYLVYIGIMISYIVYKQKYVTLPRGFKNPLGISTACLGICIFTICAISIIGFEKNQSHVALVFLIFYILAVSFYYFRYARFQQKFSDNEQNVMFSAYVINGMFLYYYFILLLVYYYYYYYFFFK